MHSILKRFSQNLTCTIPDRIITHLNCKFVTNKDSSQDGWIAIREDQQLPKLPVPPLEQTLEKYEKTMKPLLDENQYNRLKHISQRFLKDEHLGLRLQSYLLKRKEALDNWALDYWLDDMYLTQRTPLPIFSNPCFTYLSELVEMEDVCSNAARLIKRAIMIYCNIKNNIYPIGSKTNLNQSCVKQYHDLFGTCRIPGKLVDHIYAASSNDIQHVIVIYRNDFYVLPIYNANGDVIDEQTIYLQLLHIMHNNTGTKSSAVGLLTTIKRDAWWEARENLCECKTNRRNLELIETSLTVLCLDEQIIYENTYGTEKDLLNSFRFGGTLHGYGSKHNTGNRWFDKCFQIIASKDVYGLCTEHSISDGTVGNRFTTVLFNSLCEPTNINIKPNLKISRNILPKKLEWVLQPKDLYNIDVAGNEIDKIIQNLDLKFYTFASFGKDFIKSRNCSPDAFVQLAFQLTYYQIYGRLCSSYESGATIGFKLGRVDCIRAVRSEVFDWVKRMKESNSSIDRTTYTQFKTAISVQQKEAKDTVSGHGIDTHLLGLREAAKSISPPIALPELFTDESYKIANHFQISSSQVGNYENMLWAYGPVTNDGYGIFYNLHTDKIIFVVTCLPSEKVVSALTFLNVLQESIQDMKKIIDFVE